MTKVFVYPGITGTNLDAVSGGVTVQVWPNVVTLVAEGPGLLELAPDGEAPGPLATWGPLRSGALVALGYYEPLFRAIRLAELVPVAVGFDWRKSLRVEAARIAPLMNDTAGTSDYYAMCHSMGGLLARLVYDAMGDTPTRRAWKRTVYLGTPHGGSHTASANMAGYMPAWANYVAYWSLAYPFLATILGRPWPPVGIPALILQTIASWPGFYELFPSTAGPWADLDPKAPSLYTLGRWRESTPSNPHITQQRLTEAKATVDYLAGLIGQAAPEQLCVIGTTYPTMQSVADQQKLGAPEGWSAASVGDGTVTRERGVLPGSMVLEVKGAHMSYMRDEEVLQLIQPMLMGTPPGTITLSPGPPPPRLAPPIQVTGHAPPWPYLMRRGDP